MLNRKESKATNGSQSRVAGNGHARGSTVKPAPLRRRFIISSKAPVRPQASAPTPAVTAPKVNPATKAKEAYANSHTTPAAGAPSQPVDLAETIKTLLHLAQEHGHVTYDDINDILPDGLSPEDLDELYTKLRNLDVERDFLGLGNCPEIV